MIIVPGRISYSPALGSMHPMHRIAADREDRPYDSMADIPFIETRPPHAK
jgi:hypothetical protein